MQPNKIMYIDLADPLPKSYAPKKGEEMNRSTYSTMRYNNNIIDTTFELLFIKIFNHCLTFVVKILPSIFFYLYH